MTWRCLACVALSVCDILEGGGVRVYECVLRMHAFVLCVFKCLWVFVCMYVCVCVCVR